ncbi:MAG: non-canonical purine NTP pyrophosphatase [Verrucomicrobiota bacterium]|nr:non-canonical purine NTP pyrophosphatase [Verrucomicrobiota bacterium]
MVLFIASRNTHKAGEIHAMLGGQFELLTLDHFPEAPKVVEDASTFAGNATKKAVGLAHWLSASRHPPPVVHRTFVLADDSGLEVDAIQGAPGVHSARFAALDSGRPGNSPDAENNAELLRLLKDVPTKKRTARFHCVTALVPVSFGKVEAASPVCYDDEFEPQIFDGVCEGRILFAPRGSQGFGYDPLFVPAGFEQTFAELGEEVKNRISHRARALEKVKKFLEGHECQGRRAAPA